MPKSYLLLAPKLSSVNSTPSNKKVEEIIKTLLKETMLLIGMYVKKKNTNNPKIVKIICLTRIFSRLNESSDVILNKVNQEITLKRRN
jgi:hypothetical protein